MSHQIKVTV